METNTAQSAKTQTLLNLACWAVSEDPGPAMHSKQLTPGHPFYSVEVTGLGVSKGMKITIRHESRNEDENIQLS